MALAPPTGLGLFGGSAAEREESRGDSSLRITFDLVTGADNYELRVNGGSAIAVLPGDTIAIGGFNSKFGLQARSMSLIGEASDWSSPFLTVSRPPTPPAPKRRPYDLEGWGIAIDWEMAQTFPGSAASRITLQRQHELEPAEDLATQRGRSDSYVDTSYRPDAVKHYRLLAIVPRSAVPDDLLGGPNASRPGPEMTAVYPYNMVANLAPARLDALQEARTQLLEGMLGLGLRL